MNIVSEGFDGKYQLMRNGKAVQIGEVFETKNDKVSYVILKGTAPHKEGSTGRIDVRQGNGNLVRSFFPGVLDMTWVKIQ